MTIAACSGTCRRGGEDNVRLPVTSQPTTGQATVPSTPAGGATRVAAPLCADPPGRQTLQAGLIWQRFDTGVASPAKVGDRCIDLIRIDPARFRFRLLSAQQHGAPRIASEWALELDQAGVINASMYHPNGASTGLLIDDGQVRQGKDNPQFGAYFAFEPTRGELPYAALAGRGCPGFSRQALRRDYRTVVQNYRLLDCDGGPIRWQDDKAYSAAAVAVDRRGWVVFIHARTPYRMTTFSQQLARSQLDLQAAMYVEGGPEATLYVASSAAVVHRIGSYESRFWENDDNQRPWPLPNVIAFAPRPSAGLAR